MMMFDLNFKIREIGVDDVEGLNRIPFASGFNEAREPINGTEISGFFHVTIVEKNQF